MKRYTIFVLLAVLVAGSAFAQGDTGSKDAVVQPFFQVEKNGMRAQRAPGSQQYDFAGTNFVHGVTQIDETLSTIDTTILRNLGWAWFHNAPTVTNAGAHGEVQLGHTNAATFYPLIALGTNEWAGPFKLYSDNVSMQSTSGTNTVEYFIMER